MHASLQGHSQNSQKNWGVGLIFRVTGPHNWNSIPATMQEISVLFEFTGVARRFKSNFFVAHGVERLDSTALLCVNKTGQPNYRSGGQTNEENDFNKNAFSCLNVM